MLDSTPVSIIILVFFYFFAFYLVFILHFLFNMPVIQFNVYYARPPVGKEAVSVAFCLSVCPSVACIANNSRTQRPSVPKFGRKVPHLRCDSRTSFKVKGQGH